VSTDFEENIWRRKEKERERKRKKRMKANQGEEKLSIALLITSGSFSIKTIWNSVDASIEWITRNIRLISVLSPSKMK
jgi:hypothetical protein